MSKLSDYFSDNELKCKKSGAIKLDPRFKSALLLYRETLSIPLFVNSCCRSIQHNKEIGGAKRSYHLFQSDDGREGTLAIDLKVHNSATRGTMVYTAWKLGWSVVIYKGFIHIDRRKDLGSEQIMFWGKY